MSDPIVLYRAPTIVGVLTLAGQVVGKEILGLARKELFHEKVCALLHRNTSIRSCPLTGVPVGAATVKVPAAPVWAISHCSDKSALHVYVVELASVVTRIAGALVVPTKHHFVKFALY